MAHNSESYDFAGLFTRHISRFTAYAATYVGKDDAEDIVMDAFLYYWERRMELTRVNPPAYILTTVKHRCLNHLRSKKVQTAAVGNLADHACRVLNLKISTLEALDPCEIFPDNVQSALQKAIDSLPVRTREVLVRSRFHGQTYKEIAEELSITVKSVEFELTKAMRRLRAMLKNGSL